MWAVDNWMFPCQIFPIDSYQSLYMAIYWKKKSFLAWINNLLQKYQCSNYSCTLLEVVGIGYSGHLVANSSFIPADDLWIILLQSMRSLKHWQQRDNLSPKLCYLITVYKMNMNSIALPTWFYLFVVLCTM